MNIFFNNKYLKKIFYKKLFLKLLNISVFKNILIIINFISLFNIFLLNKKYKLKKNITDCFTFNYYKKSYIFLSYSFISRNSKNNKLKTTFLIFYNIIHCLLHTQNFKDDKFKNFKKILFLQKKILIKYGFFLKNQYRL
ncbi:rRNA maturation RNAse YbeY [Candidatus Nasuia deltocephalinicola]|uniref:rRNA maturation RNAse YbeY n=1 Tax=Candidatus Nasuia deltocephalincola TaxID=1160784 RepID=UPI00216AFA2E|nr:rRNA maturation RNAse YbeY [Candidatus Nasuia deltocephalinicola]